jgi:cell division septal protein FtsQ
VGKRRRTESRKRKPQRRTFGMIRWVLIAALLAGVGVFGFGLFKFLREGSYFQLSNIEITNQTRAKREEILGCLNVRMGDNLVFLNEQEVRRRVEAHPWVHHARVGKRLPDTLWIELEERSPVALLSNARDGSLYGLDAEGYVLPSLPIKELAENNFPVVTGIPAVMCFAGNLLEFPVPDSVTVVVTEVLRSPRLRESISEIHWDPRSGYVLYPRHGARQVFLGKKAIRERVSILEQAWAFLTAESIEASYVDARFPSQGVVFRAESLPESRWLAYLEREQKASRQVVAAVSRPDMEEGR